MGGEWDADGTRPYQERWRLAGVAETAWQLAVETTALPGAARNNGEEFQDSSWKFQGAGCFQRGDDFIPNPKLEIRGPKET